MVRFWATIILCFEDSAWSRGLARKADASTDHMGQDRSKAQRVHSYYTPPFLGYPRTTLELRSTPYLRLHFALHIP